MAVDIVDTGEEVGRFGEKDLVQRFRQAIATRLSRRPALYVLRSIFPEVDAALKAGVTYADLMEAMVEIGALERPVGIQVLRNYVARIRKERAHAAEKDVAQAKVARPAAPPTQVTEPALQAAAPPASTQPIQEPAVVDRDHDAPVVDPEASAAAPSAEIASAEPVVEAANAEVPSSEPVPVADREKTLPAGVTRKGGRTFMNVKAMLGDHTRSERFEFVDAKPGSAPSL